ncbi:MAG: HD domain-containing protein [Chitinophagaceae bacterium]|nr:HD domain-containing protein [Chitinophagaceae bacterium]
MDQITKQVESYVISLYEKNQFPALLFHSLSHTQQVVQHVEELSSYYRLSPKDHFSVVVAAWFHDTGHLFSVVEGHEDISWKIAEEYLLPLDIEKIILRKIRACILATKMPTHPRELIEKIICDSDTYHLGTDAFIITDDLIKREMQLREDIDSSDWDSRTLTFLKSHQFHTDYCRQKLTDQKDENIRTIERRIEKTQARNAK